MKAGNKVRFIDKDRLFFRAVKKAFYPPVGWEDTSENVPGRSEHWLCLKNWYTGEFVKGDTWDSINIPFHESSFKVIS